MHVKEAVRQNPAAFDALCRGCDVTALYAFGSATNASFKDDASDIDLLVEIDTGDPIKRGENILTLWDKLEVFFQRKVDLLTDAYVRNPYLKKCIDESKTLIYDGKGQEIPV